jgi:predicted transcriptional regulator
MVSVLASPKTTVEIENEVHLPQSTLYRKITELKESGLLMIDRYEVRSDGRREAVYTCPFSEVHMKVEGGQLVFDVIESERGKERRFFDLFFGRSDSSG